MHTVYPQRTRVKSFFSEHLFLHPQHYVALDTATWWHITQYSTSLPGIKDQLLEILRPWCVLMVCRGMCKLMVQAHPIILTQIFSSFFSSVHFVMCFIHIHIYTLHLFGHVLYLCAHIVWLWSYWIDIHFISKAKNVPLSVCSDLIFQGWMSLIVCFP